jgi:phospholipid/cholesterol/gamma-HCH transport system substrate-binding protein
LANFYNIYSPAQGSVGGLLSLPNFANPVQFICGGAFEIGGTPDEFKRTELCRQRMAPVLKRITMNYPPVLFHPINSIQAYKGQIIYDTPATEAKAQTPVPYLQWESPPGVTPPVIPPDATLTDLLLPPASEAAPGQPAAAVSTSHAGGPEGTSPPAEPLPAEPPPAAPLPAGPLPADGGGG